MRSPYDTCCIFIVSTGITRGTQGVIRISREE
jgi:hypothetical protein